MQALSKNICVLFLWQNMNCAVPRGLDEISTAWIRCIIKKNIFNSVFLFSTLCWQSYNNLWLNFILKKMKKKWKQILNLNLQIRSELSLAILLFFATFLHFILHVWCPKCIFEYLSDYYWPGLKRFINSLFIRPNNTTISFKALDLTFQIQTCSSIIICIAMRKFLHELVSIYAASISKWNYDLKIHGFSICYQYLHLSDFSIYIIVLVKHVHTTKNNATLSTRKMRRDW